MRVLFVSHLGDSPSAGPHWSVPARVKAQTKYDDVFWVNIVNTTLPQYQDTGVYHTLSEFKKLSLESLPPPFNYPDVVAFEGFYAIEEPKFAKELRKRNIPYVITPRGSLTRQARHNGSRLKKEIAHFLLFDKYIKGARAIQFLTKQEQIDSISSCSESYILSNGFYTPEVVKGAFSENEIKGIFIGRIDLYHKGLDNLVNSVLECCQILRDSHFTIAVYGPHNNDSNKLQQIILEKEIGDIITLKGEISGEEKKQAILDSDVFILPSRFEGHPMGLVEALAYGLPCLVSTGSNMRDEIEIADAGWTCDSDVESLTKALVRITKDKCLFSEKSGHALKLAKEYDWDMLAKKFHEVLNELICES